MIIIFLPHHRQKGERSNSINMNVVDHRVYQRIMGSGVVVISIGAAKI